MTRAAVYRLYDEEGVLLYVGATTNPRSRFAAHQKRTWWPLVARQDVRWFPTVKEAFDAESSAIHRERPRHNRAIPSLYDPSKAQFLMGSQEVGLMLGVNRQRVSQLAATPDFPEPAARLAGGSVWFGEDVVAWADAHRRMAVEEDELAES